MAFMETQESFTYTVTRLLMISLLMKLQLKTLKSAVISGSELKGLVTIPVYR